MITYNGNGGMDTVAVGLNERGSTLRQLPEGDVQLIRAYAGQHSEILQHTSLHVFHCLSDGRARTYFLIGLEGKPIRYSTYEDFRMARRLMAAAMKEGVSELAVMADTLDMDLGSLIDGLLYRNYEFNHYKRQAKSRTIGNINILTHSLRPKEFNSMCYMYTSIYEGIYAARDLVNMPSNDLTPRKFADIVGAMSLEALKGVMNAFDAGSGKAPYGRHRRRRQGQYEPAPAPVHCLPGRP